MFEKRLVYYIALVLLLLIPSVALAQNRPNAIQNKNKPRVYPSAQGGQIKHNKLVKTSDPGDEYSGVRTDPYGVKKPKKKVDNDTVDVADDVEAKNANVEPFFYEDQTHPEVQEPVEKKSKPQERRTIEEIEDEAGGVITPEYAMTIQDDPGAESEEDILMAGDSSAVHSLKMDISNMQPVEIHLTDPAAGKFFVFPTPSYSRPSSHFGPRRRRFHYGIDLSMPTGEPIYAAFDGVVRFSKYNKSYGNLIVIRHDNGLETYYAHLSKRLVTPGTRVRAGEEIGLCGNTGRSRGSHLHFEIRYNGNAINPEDVVSCETRTLVQPTLTLTKDSFRKVAKSGHSNTVQRSSGGSTGNYSSDGKYYKIRTGDTLSRIAQRNGTSVKRLCQLNGLKETSILRPGQTIRLR